MDTKNRAEQLEEHLQVLVDAIKAFLSPEVCAYFLIRLRGLAAQRGEGAFFDELCKNIRKAMTEPEVYNFTRVVLALSYQRFFAQVDAIIERIQGKEQNHPIVAEDVTLSATGDVPDKNRDPGRTRDGRPLSATKMDRRKSASTLESDPSE